MKKIILIGGSGYIGTVLTKRLLDDGFYVKNIDFHMYNNNQAIDGFTNNPNYEHEKQDFAIKDNIKISKDFDTVVLLGGLVGDPITKKYPKESSLINDQGVKNVIDVCSSLAIKNFIFISTCSNYGLIENNDFANEESALNPLSLYAESKVNAEKYILSLKGKTGMNPTILRFATAFGLSPRMRFDLTISEFTREIALGNHLLVYDAKTWRPYCHVEDFSTLILEVINAPEEKVAWEVFNAGGDKNNATKETIVNLILKRIPDGKVRFKEFGSDPRNYRVDFTKVKKILNFEPKYSIEDGVDELIDQINKHNFVNLDNNINFYGNYNINYKV